MMKKVEDMQSVPKGHRERMSAERGEKMSVPKGHDKRVCENTKDVPEDEECPRRQKMQGKVQALTLVLQIWLWRGLWPRSPPPNENTPGAGENCRGDSESLWKAISIVLMEMMREGSLGDGRSGKSGGLQRTKARRAGPCT